MPLRALSCFLLLTLKPSGSFLTPLLLSLGTFLKPLLLSGRVWRPAASWHVWSLSCSLSVLSALLGDLEQPQALLLFPARLRKVLAQAYARGTTPSCRVRFRSPLVNIGLHVLQSRWQSSVMP